MQRLRETKFVGMEYFGSRDEITRRASLDEVDRSHIYIGIFAGRYGSGVTEDEYRRARELHLPCFTYLKDEATISAEWREPDTDKAVRLAALKEDIRKAHTVITFSTPDDLAAKLTADLHRWLVDAYLNPRLEVTTTRHSVKPERPPEGFVPRAAEFDQLLAYLLDPRRNDAVAITAALRGAGGYGKTTLAKALCQDPRVIEAFPDGILWVELGQDPGDLTGKVLDLVEALSDQRPSFTSAELAKTRLNDLLSQRNSLLVIDDLWNRAHLETFMQGRPRCSFLITTRNLDTLPASVRQVKVDAMKQDEAGELLSSGLPLGYEKEMRDLAKRLGNWPLLLKLANGQLLERVNYSHQSLDEAVAWVNWALDKRGLTAFDARDPKQRDQAVVKTVGASLELLSTNERARYNELAVFPEGTNVPLATLEKHWRIAGLDEFDTEELCGRLNRLSLVSDFNAHSRYIRLHDVMRKYLIDQNQVGLLALNRQLLDAHRPPGQWADLSEDEPYLWDRLAWHLAEAGLYSELIATAKDLCYLARKTWVSDALMAQQDLRQAERYIEDSTLRLLRDNFGNCGHLLNYCNRTNGGRLADLMATLECRLEHVEGLTPLAQQLQKRISSPYITQRHSLPDRSHPALIRTLAGHTRSVSRCAISADGSIVVSASDDRTLKVWSAQTGEVRLTLRGHTSVVFDCAISLDGSLIVSASWDRTLKVWDACSGEELLILQGHTSGVIGCAISPDSSFIVSASGDNTLKVWDATTGEVRLTLQGHTDHVIGCAISADGLLIVSASKDKTLKVWDVNTGEVRMTFQGHTDSVTGCAISPDGSFIVSASKDRTLKLWDARTGEVRLVLHHTISSQNHYGGCAISPDGSFVVSGSSDHGYTLNVWDATTGEVRLALPVHSHCVIGCAISLDGSFIVSASIDGTLQMWDSRSSQRQLTPVGSVTGCAISADDSLVVSASWPDTLSVWDTHSGQERLTILDIGGASGCAISPDGSFIVSASWPPKVWDARSGQERLSLEGHTYQVIGCAISPDGSFIVTAGTDNTLKLWDASTGEVRITLQGHSNYVRGCAISPDGSLIVSASSDRTLKVWDVETGKVRRTLQGHADSVNGCAISRDGLFVVSASDDNKLKVWDVETGELCLTLDDHTGDPDRYAVGPESCAISPDGAFIVSTSNYDHALKVWDIAKGTCVAAFYAEDRLSSCAWFKDAQHLLAGGDAGVYFLRFVR